MATEAEVFIDRFENIHDEVKGALQGMSAEELNWSPTDSETNSPCALATHIAGTEGMSIHQVIGGIDIHRDRDAEFAAKDSTVADLVALLDRTLETSRRVLGGLSADELGATREFRAGEPPVQVRWVLVNLIGHLGQHLGHLSLTKQVYEAGKR